MGIRLQNVWYWIKSSLWFFPGVLCLSSILLAFFMLQIDNELFRDTRLLYTGNADAARQLLSTLAGSIITVTGIVFSIMIVALSQASMQFGPRLLRNFMHDHMNQLVLGDFIGTFIYCFVILRSIPGTRDRIPELSITMAVVLVLISMGLLIFFLNHISETLQVDKLVASISAELYQTIKHLYPEYHGEDGQSDHQNRSETSQDPNNGNGPTVPSKREGYVQGIDTASLSRYAEKGNIHIGLLTQPGEFTYESKPLIRLIGYKKNVSTKLFHYINSLFIIGVHRTPTQDIKYDINLLVEIAVRALSPAVNAPVIAQLCIDRLGAVHCELLKRELMPNYLIHENGKSRLIMKIDTFENLLHLSFDQIVHFGKVMPSIMIRLFERMHNIAQSTVKEKDKNAVKKYSEFMIQQLDYNQKRAKEKIGEYYQSIMAI